MRRQERKFPMTKKASLGISGTGVSDEAAEAYGIPSGVFVSQVTEGGAAEQAGITANSIITAFDGNPSAISAN